MIISPLGSYEDKCIIYCQFRQAVNISVSWKSYWLYKQPFLGQTDFTGTMHPHIKHSIFLLSLAWMCVHAFLYVHVYVSGKYILRKNIHTHCTYIFSFLMCTLHCGGENCTISCFFFFLPVNLVVYYFH